MRVCLFTAISCMIDHLSIAVTHKRIKLLKNRWKKMSKNRKTFQQGLVRLKLRWHRMSQWTLGNTPWCFPSLWTITDSNKASTTNRRSNFSSDDSLPQWGLSESPSQLQCQHSYGYSHNSWTASPMAAHTTASLSFFAIRSHSKLRILPRTSRHILNKYFIWN